jgi:hypothetical protein
MYPIQKNYIYAQGNTFRPYPIGGEKADNDAQGKQGEQGQPVQGPQLFDKRPDQGQKDKEGY